MALTLVASYYADSVGTSTDPIVTSAFTPSNGEVIVVKLETWDTAQAMGAPTGGSQTYTSRVTVAPGGFRPWCGIYTAVISGSPGSMTISSTPSASSRYSMCVERWSGGQLAGTPATGSADASSGAASCSITTAAANSVVSWVASDAQSVSPSTRAYLNSATDEGVRDDSAGADGVAYHARATIASAGAVTVGLSAPTGMQYCIAAIEVQVAAGGTNLDVGNDALSVVGNAATLAVGAQVGNDALSVAANAATLKASISTGNDALSVVANAATLKAAIPTGNAGVSVTGNAATLAVKISAGNDALSVGAFDVALVVGTQVAVGNDALSVAAGSATLAVAVGVGNDALSVAVNATALAVATGVGGAALSAAANTAGLGVAAPAGAAALSVGAFDVSLLYGIPLAADGGMVSVGAFDVTLGTGGMVGNAHGPLPLAVGAVTVHTVTIVGAIT